MRSPGIYGISLALLTDLYQLTMAQGYWARGMQGHEAIFHLSFRRPPFSGGYAVAAGLATAVDFLDAFRFTEEDLAYLTTLKGNDGRALFVPEFLDYLQRLELTCDIDAVPEGTVVFGHEPLVRVQGPLLQCQLLETALLNIINFQTLIATKAARTCYAAGDEPVLEFGLRRAQGIDGGISASRAAIIGGCAATSNLLAGRLYGVEVRGTHAHSWVMSFDSELDAFEAYAEALPNNVVFLVDTYDTLRGVEHAIDVGRKLRERGHHLAGIRLDSGDLAWLSIKARAMLDEAGFPDTGIIASNDLCERTIRSLKEQGSQIAVWGVGTNLTTAKDQPALGGVYKLAAIRAPGKPWRHKVKLSEQRAKTSTPGKLQVRRYTRETERGTEFAGDMIFDELAGPPATDTIVDPLDDTRRKRLAGPHTDLLQPVYRDGRFVGHDVVDHDVLAVRQNTLLNLSQLHAGIKRFDNPHQYPAGLELSLHEVRTRLILRSRSIVG